MLPGQFDRGRRVPLAEIARWAGADLAHPEHGSATVSRLGALAESGPHHLTFFDGRSGAEALRRTRAAACLLRRDDAAALPQGVAALWTDAPFRSFVAVAQTWYADDHLHGPWFGTIDRAESAVIHPSARFEDDVVVDPLVTIGPDVAIGAGTAIGAGAVIGAGVRIGRGCRIGPGASIARALIGNGVAIQPGCRIGDADVPTADDAAALPAAGRVILQHGVALGAGAVIRRGALGDTVVGERTRLGAQVAVGAEGWIGRLCRLETRVILGAGARLGDAVQVGAAALIGAGVHIAEGKRVAAMAMIAHDTPDRAGTGEQS